MIKWLTKTFLSDYMGLQHTAHEVLVTRYREDGSILYVEAMTQEEVARLLDEAVRERRRVMYGAQTLVASENVRAGEMVAIDNSGRVRRAGWMR